MEAEIMRVESRLEGMTVDTLAARFVDGIEVYRIGDDRFVLMAKAGQRQLTMAQAARAILGMEIDQ